MNFIQFPPVTSGDQTGGGDHQPLDETLTALAGLNASPGLVEQTGADTFAKRALGVAAGTSVPTRADGDARWASLYYAPPFSGAASPYVITDRLADVPHSRDFGLRTSTVNEQTSELQAFLTGSIGYRAIMEKGTFLTDATVTVGASGLWLVGAGGAFDQTIIRGTHTIGPVIRVIGRATRLEGLCIDATTTRRSGAGANGHGIWIAQDDTASQASLTSLHLRDILIRYQPQTGLMVHGQIQWSIFEQVYASYCLGHGAVFDDGTVSGYTNKPIACGIFTVNHLDARQNAGHGLIVYGYRVHLNQLELNANAWDSATRLSHHQARLSLDTGIVTNSAYGDVEYDDATIGSTGLPRTVLANPSEGVFWTGCRHTTVEGCRYIGLTRSGELDATTANHHWHERDPTIIKSASWLTNQPFGFLISDSTLWSSLHITPNSGADAPADVQEETFSLHYDQSLRKGLAMEAKEQLRFILGEGHTALPHTGDTAETILATVTVPMGSMGVNDQLEVYSLWEGTGTGNKAHRVRLNGIAGTAYLAVTTTTQLGLSDLRTIRNRNSVVSQIGSNNASGGGIGATTGAPTTSAVNMNLADRDIVFTAQLTNAAETITLHSYKVTLVRT